MNESVCFWSSCACASPVRTCAVLGRIDRTSLSSSGWPAPCFFAIEISSSRPGLPKSFCAVGSAKPASVAPPSDAADPNLTIPEMRN